MHPLVEQLKVLASRHPYYTPLVGWWPQASLFPAPQVRDDEMPSGGFEAIVAQVAPECVTNTAPPCREVVRFSSSGKFCAEKRSLSRLLGGVCFFFFLL